MRSILYDLRFFARTLRKSWGGLARWRSSPWVSGSAPTPLLENRGNAWLSALGRLASGVSPEGAQAELEGIARELAQEHPAVYASRTGMRVVPFWRSPRGAQASLAPVLFLLMGVVAMVLLLACANVANLLLARATSRRREVAVRVAVGAGRGRILRQLLTESVALSLLAGVVGLAIAYLTSDLLRALAPPTDLPIGLQLGIDDRVLGFTLLLAVLTGVGFGLVPALGASRSDVAAQLRDESGTFAGRAAGRLAAKRAGPGSGGHLALAARLRGALAPKLGERLGVRSTAFSLTPSVSARQRLGCGWPLVRPGATSCGSCCGRG
jgi:putative ABC transport system permease protein